MLAPVDLRSDTVTRPTPAMRQAMAGAAVGDDVFGEDPTVHALQSRAALMMGHEAALFVPSGTMGNQIALLTHCRPGDDVLVGQHAHACLYESGAGAAIAGVQFTTVGQGGHFDADQMQAAIHGLDRSGHVPPTTLVMVENTHNRGGGKVMPPDAFAAIAARARARGLAVHVDGARLFNAAAACGVEPAAWTRHADTVTFCLSKGLGAPVGSVLCGSEAVIARAHRYRKMLGGGMRQAGVLAAAGLCALDDAPQLVDDHRRARALAEALGRMKHARIDPAAVQTNIVIFEATDHAPVQICGQVADDVLVLPFGPRHIRAVLHRDVDDAMLARAIDALKAVLDG